MLESYKNNRYLFWQLVKKDITGKYNGSVLGWAWPILVPVLMLFIYTFFFSVVFQARWGTSVENRYEFALMMFCGLSVFNVLSDVMGRSTSLIAVNVSYVKKVVFPLDLLPVVITLSALFNSLISFVILIVARIVVIGPPSVVLIEGIVGLIPLALFCIGVSYILSSLSVYIKDFSNVISVLITVMMYISPVFYSIDNLPVEFRRFVYLNPMTYMIENFRNVFLRNKSMSLRFFIISMVISIFLYALGRTVFKRLCKGFADVL